MASDWFVLHYGKLIGPDGASKSGFMVTETSRGFPGELKEVCQPSVVGVTDHTNWANFNLRGSQATLVLRPVNVRGTWYLHAVRLRIRGEGLNGQVGRFFHQTAHLLHPVECLSDPTDLWGLPGLVNNGLPDDKRYDLPTARVSSSDVPLPLGWFDARIRSLLAAIVSGAGVTMHEPNLPPDAMFQIALQCLACLPTAVRWRIPIGAGFFETPADWGVAHGQKVAGTVKWQGGRLHNTAADLGSGEEYVQWVRPLAESATSVGGLIRSVDAKFRGLGSDYDLSHWDGLGTDDRLSWGDAVRSAVEAIRVLELVPQFEPFQPYPTSAFQPPEVRQSPIAQGLPAPRDTSLRRYGRFFVDALRTVLRAARKFRPGGRDSEPRSSLTDDPDGPAKRRITTFIDETLVPAFSTEWARLAAQQGQEAEVARTLRALAGFAEPFDLSQVHVDSLWLLPERLIPSAVERLTQAFFNPTDTARPRDERLLTVYDDLIKAAGKLRAPAVLREWRRRDEAGLVWRGITSQRDNRHFWMSWDAADLGPSYRAAAAVLNEKLPNFEDWVTLCQSEPLYASETAGELHRKLVRLWLQVSSAERGRQVPQLIQLIEKSPIAPARLSQLLVLSSTDLTETNHHELHNTIGVVVDQRRMSPTFAYLAFDKQLSLSNATLIENEESVLAELLPNDASIQLRLLRLAGRLSGVVADRLIGRLFMPQLKVAHPLVNFLRSLWSGTTPPCHMPETTLAEAAGVARVATQFRGIKIPRSCLASATTLDQLRTCAALLGTQISWFQDADAELRRQMLTEAARSPEAEEFWRLKANTENNRQTEVLRLLTPRTPEPSTAEEKLLLDLPDDVFLKYVLQFEEITIPLYARLLTTLCRSTTTVNMQQIFDLAQVAQLHQDANLYDCVMRSFVRLCSQMDRSESNLHLRKLARFAVPQSAKQHLKDFLGGYQLSLHIPTKFSLRK
jgi:hypothetical protein